LGRSTKKEEKENNLKKLLMLNGQKKATLCGTAI